MLKKYSKILVVLVFILVFSSFIFAHSGRTDSSGGHKDNKNASGLGSYHYHCGGHPAHLHSDGICPYSSNIVQKNNVQQNSTKNNTPTVNNAEKIEVKKVIENVKIIYNDTEINVNDKVKLSVKVYPEGIKEKNFAWSSSDKSIISIDNNGNIVAKSEGTVTIKVTVNNAVSDSIL